jgi:hypothetical protein
VPYTVFAGGVVGAWRVESIEPVTGPSLPLVSRLAIFGEGGLGELDVAWTLRGLTSNLRYTRRNEQDALAATQAELGRPEATRAALIPITKSEAWWRLSQDERRELFEERSHHIAIGLEYLPAVARRLYHGHDLDEGFDFLTWFEYAPQNAPRSRNSYPDSARPPSGNTWTEKSTSASRVNTPFSSERSISDMIINLGWEVLNDCK